MPTKQLLQAAGDGTAVPAGYIGQEIRATVTTNTSFPSTGVFGDAANISLTTGVWDISMVVFVDNGPYTATQFSLGVSKTQGNSSTGLSAGDNYISIAPGGANTAVSGIIPPYRVIVTAASEPWYLKVQGSYSVGTPQYRCRISAVRIA